MRELISMPIWAYLLALALSSLISCFLKDMSDGHKRRKAERSKREEWHPSQEQLDALDEVYKTHGANSSCRRVIFGLLNDLINWGTNEMPGE